MYRPIQVLIIGKKLDSPRYNDFWSQNIDMKGQKVQNGTYNGEDYRYLVLRKTVFYPQKTGKLNIEPLSLDISVASANQ